MKEIAIKMATSLLILFIRKGVLQSLVALLAFAKPSKAFAKPSKKYVDARKKALELLEEAIRKKKIDEKILPIVKKLNSKFDFFTTSSCSGRIAIMEIPCAGIKKKAKFLGKWHRKVDAKEIKGAIEKAKKGEIWFLVQSPIIHVSTFSMENARKLLVIANQSGFKYSSIKSFNGRIVVEILGTERIDAPIGKDSKIYGGEDYIDMLTDIANFMMERMEANLRKLERNIDRL